MSDPTHDPAQTGTVATAAAPAPQVSGDQLPPHIEYIDPRDYVRLPRRSSPVRRLLIVGVLFFFAFTWVVRTVDDWVAKQVVPVETADSDADGVDIVDDEPEPVELIEFVIEEGEPTNTTAQKLASADVISNSTIFRYWLRCPARFKGLLDCEEEQKVSFQSGKYLLEENMGFQAAVDKLNEGSIPPEDIRVTIPEGLTLDQIIDRLLSENPKYMRDDFFVEIDNERVGSRFIDDSMELRAATVGFRSPLEGLLFPSTYDVSEDNLSNEVSILRNMAFTMEQVFDRSLATAGGSLPEAALDERLNLSEYDILTIASLIEEEAKVDADRPKIARVIYNRLLKGWTLGIDASTRYAVNKPPGEPLLVSEIEDDSSPYNTRAASRTGLPPTPIAAPGEASILAALMPEEGEWLYYVLTDEGGVPGAHTFAVTDGDFQAAKRICQDLGYC